MQTRWETKQNWQLISLIVLLRSAKINTEFFLIGKIWLKVWDIGCILIERARIRLLWKNIISTSAK